MLSGFAVPALGSEAVLIRKKIALWRSLLLCMLSQEFLCHGAFGICGVWLRGLGMFEGVGMARMLGPSITLQP